MGRADLLVFLTIYDLSYLPFVLLLLNCSRLVALSPMVDVRSWGYIHLVLEQHKLWITDQLG